MIVHKKFQLDHFFIILGTIGQTGLAAADDRQEVVEEKENMEKCRYALLTQSLIHSLMHSSTSLLLAQNSYDLKQLKNAEGHHFASFFQSFLSVTSKK